MTVKVFSRGYFEEKTGLPICCQNCKFSKQRGLVAGKCHGCSVDYFKEFPIYSHFRPKDYIKKIFKNNVCLHSWERFRLSEPYKRHKDSL